jgi:hypothetical protein
MVGQPADPSVPVQDHLQWPEGDPQCEGQRLAAGIVSGHLCWHLIHLIPLQSPHKCGMPVGRPGAGFVRGQQLHLASQEFGQRKTAQPHPGPVHQVQAVFAHLLEVEPEPVGGRVRVEYPQQVRTKLESRGIFKYKIILYLFYYLLFFIRYSLFNYYFNYFKYIIYFF